MVHVRALAIGTRPTDAAEAHFVGGLIGALPNNDGDASSRAQHNDNSTSDHSN